MNQFMRRLLMLPHQASTVSRDLDYLHYSVITVTMVGAFGIALATVIFVIYYRRSKGRGHRPPATLQRHRTAGGVPYWFEAVIIAGLLSLFLLWWVIGFRQYVKVERAPADALGIYVTGKQWMWSFAYPNGAGSTADLYVPIGRPIKLTLTSRDVIHSFFVPAFRIKQDVIPGRATTMWFQVDKPGTYDLYCAEYCGTNHSTMRGKVIALPPEKYVEKLRGLGPIGVAGSKFETPQVVGQSAPKEQLSLAEVGRRVAADKGCLRCHTVDGTPHIGPTWAGLFGSQVSLESGKKVTADPAYLTQSMMDPTAKIVLGFSPVMPSYQGRLTAAETGALVELIRSLKDVTPGKKEPLPVPPDAEMQVVRPAGSDAGVGPGADR